MVQWNENCRIALTELFEKRLADPALTKAADIDSYYELAPIFKEACKVERFRTNFRNHASDCLRDQAMSGKRRREFRLAVTFVACDQNSNTRLHCQIATGAFQENPAHDDVGDAPPEDDEECQPEETKDVKPESPESKKLKVNPKPKPVPKMTSKKAGDVEAKNDEILIDLPMRAHACSANNFFRERIVITPPADFDGREGSHKIGFDNDNTVLFLKFQPDPVLEDPAHITNHQKETHKRHFGDDSSAVASLRKELQETAGKWHTVRHKCHWAAELSEDFGPKNFHGKGSVPPCECVEFCTDVDNQIFSPKIIIEIKSTKPIEKQAPVRSGGMKKKKFMSPVKKIGGSPGSHAQMASMMEALHKNGLSISSPTGRQQFVDALAKMSMSPSTNNKKGGKKGTKRNKTGGDDDDDDDNEEGNDEDGDEQMSSAASTLGNLLGNK